ncbi:threonylcarbamoyl-AMP synthase [bacterium]|nr:threonylcarbamoyl-AMP synthase [bacterium]
MNNIKNEDIEKIKNGDIFIFPTETVLGLGVIYGTDTRKIYELKGRDFKKPLSLHLTKELDYLKFWRQDLPEWIKELINAAVPGPYTFIYYKNKELLSDFPFEKIGLRFPDDETFRTLILDIKTPVWGTSANISGSSSIQKLSDISPEILKSVSCVISGSNCSGKESTVIDLTENKVEKMILRQGAGDLGIIERYRRKND